jgi:hypothetical protein
MYNGCTCVNYQIWVNTLSQICILQFHIHYYFSGSLSNFKHKCSVTKLITSTDKTHIVPCDKYYFD